MVVVLLVVVFFLLDYRISSRKSTFTPRANLQIDSPHLVSSPNLAGNLLPVPVFETRNDIGTILESENFVSGVELGVQRGFFSAEVLKRWLRCREYVLVDLWAKQDNYFDGANVKIPFIMSD